MMPCVAEEEASVSKDVWRHPAMSDEVKVLLQAVQDAGDEILKVQNNGFFISTKSNNDIVTQADLLVNTILADQLLSYFPHDGWLSEETIDRPERLAAQRVWIVDPIDGTREFAKGIPEYAISVALVEGGMPILACVYNPAKGELFYAIKGKGAWVNGERMNCKGTTNSHLLLLGSRSEYARGEWTAFATLHTVKAVGSIAYKLALVASGQAHATFSLGPKNEWDIAAGTLLITEAGGEVTNKLGEKIKFNQKITTVNGIVASARENQSHVFSMLRNQDPL